MSDGLFVVVGLAALFGLPFALIGGSIAFDALGQRRQRNKVIQPHLGRYQNDLERRMRK